MSGDDRFYHPDDELNDGDFSDSEQDDSPASVIFMEMMRQAANKNQPDFFEMSPSQDAGASVPPVTPSAPASAEARREAAMEAQRIQRVKRRQAQRRRQTVGVLGGLFRSVFIVIISGGLIATILSWWTSPQSLNTQLRADLEQARATEVPVVLPTLMPTPNWLRQIGIVSGHRGPENDPGAVCPDGLTENEINFAVSQLVVLELRGRGYSVDLLEEYDSRLFNYRGAALVSIHANDCSDYGEYVSGFLVAHSEARPEGGEDSRLRDCIIDHYGAVSGIGRHFGVTRDMTAYHIFNKINATTPGVIVELGFMRADREILTGRPDLLARGVVDGILCFLEPGTDDAISEPTPLPEATD